MISPDWINKQIAFLNLRLGIYRLSAGRDFHFDPTPGFYGFISQGSTEALNEAMGMLANHIIAPSSPRIEEWDGPADPLTTMDHDWSKHQGTPGMIHYEGPFRSRIKIAITNKHTPYIMGAILAHELTHHFLANKRLGYPDEAENERFTDFATVFLGLGKLTLNGYEPIQWSLQRGDKIVTYTYQVGYLSTREIAEVMCRVCDFRSIPLADVQENLTQSACDHLNLAQDAVIQNERQEQGKQKREAKRELFKEKWRGFLARFRRKPTESISAPFSPSTVAKEQNKRKRIIECIACGQKLRVAETTQPIRVTCRVCGKEFVVAVKIPH